MRKLGIFGAVVIAGTAATYEQNSVQAQSGPTSTISASAEQAMSAETYWTAERYANAQPMPLPMATARQAMDANAMASGPVVSSDGREAVSGAGAARQLYNPDLFTQPAYSEEGGGEVAPNNMGTFQDHFTSSRLIPLTADRQYPYRPVGKLFFTIPGQGNFVCSASVISYRIIATAGHCLSNGNGSFHTNWSFVPAFRDGAAPYQTWTWTSATVTNAWHFGGGGVPNAADYGMIVLGDRFFGTTLTKIGKKTGFLGWQTNSLIANHTTMLGYPCNLDSCQKMHQVTAGAASQVAPNNVEYGSDARGGSSGGPWVQNFGVLAVGQTGGLNTGINRVVGITSYGYISLDPKVQGSSILDNNWIAVWNAVCGGAGNCTP